VLQYSRNKIGHFPHRRKKTYKNQKHQTSLAIFLLHSTADAEDWLTAIQKKELVEN